MRNKRRQVLLGHLRRNKALWQLTGDLTHYRKNGKTRLKVVQTQYFVELVARAIMKAS